jgi:diguanylate cyclase (GGDEF)-like protein
LARGVRHGEPTSILFLDLDDFKTVNDSLGHSAGDEVLIAVAERLRACLRQSDMAARFGGDEFAILLEDTGRAEAEVTARRILRTLAGPVEVHGRELRAEASIGIAVAEGDSGTQEELLRNADVAMYAAKGSGKARYAVFGAKDHVGVGPGPQEAG